MARSKITSAKNKNKLNNSLLQQIDQSWSVLSMHQTEDQDTLIGLPNPYIVPSDKPNGGFTYREMYYWDSFFIILGLLASGREQQAIYIADNLLRLVERFGYVPNANRFYMLSRSQSPFLSSIIKVVYETGQLNKTWLKRAYSLVSHEYETVWLGQMQPHNRQVFEGLSRYYDINVVHDMAEAESGWDYTTRFSSRCLDYIPIDLNCQLFKYENDLAWIAEILGETDSIGYWQDKAEARRSAINRYMWHIVDGFYYDFDYVNKEQSQVKSLAAYTSMFSGVANPQQAKQLVDSLANFETEFGLTATSIDDQEYAGKQWVSPNGWAPLHMYVHKGLMNYGYEERAKQIAQNWINLISNIYKQTGIFYEKYNVVEGSHNSVDGVYPAQTGFAWTNASYCYFNHELSLSESY